MESGRVFNLHPACSVPPSPLDSIEPTIYRGRVGGTQPTRNHLNFTITTLHLTRHQGYNKNHQQPCDPLGINPYCAPYPLHPLLVEDSPNGAEFPNSAPFCVGIALAFIGIICPAVGIALAFIGEQMKRIKAVQIRAIVGFPAFTPYNWD